MYERKEACPSIIEVIGFITTFQMESNRPCGHSPSHFVFTLQCIPPCEESTQNGTPGDTSRPVWEADIYKRMLQMASRKTTGAAKQFSHCSAAAASRKGIRVHLGCAPHKLHASSNNHNSIIVISIRGKRERDTRQTEYHQPYQHVRHK